MVLGFVAIRQTQYANQMNNKILEIEWGKNRPLLELNSMVGITMHKFNLINCNFDITSDIYCRSYELHFKYSGEMAIKSLCITDIKVKGDIYQKEFVIEK